MLAFFLALIPTFFGHCFVKEAGLSHHKITADSEMFTEVLVLASTVSKGQLPSMQRLVLLGRCTSAYNMRDTAPDRVMVSIVCIN